MLAPFLQLYLYDISTRHEFMDGWNMFASWFSKLAQANAFFLLPAAVAGTVLRIGFHRYIEPAISALLRKLRHQQTEDKPSDIREERGRFVAKDFLPEKYYREGHVFIGLDESNQPIYVEYKVWVEVNMQVIGPTRYGKGIIIGCLADQLIPRGDGFIKIDPKDDKFIPALMHQACLATGRKFYYLSLHDEGIGSWAPFAGGTLRDALSRFELAFGLELTGDPGTDFYKTQEISDLLNVFERTRNIEALSNELEESSALRIKAELKRWKQIKSLCPKNGKGFSIEKALTENAVVYVQGSLTDSVVKAATKLFIVELIQECKRLRNKRSSHLTIVVDEVRFLVSKVLADALATIVGFNVNIVTAYQSIKDLQAPDDKTLDGESILQSINVNSQLKAVYGGADFDTAEWIANLSGVIQKNVTKMEKTEIRKSGGEIWEDGRAVGTQEENLIPTNTVLTLPPRICVTIQPGKNATPCFTSFVPVKDTDALPKYLAHKEKVYSHSSESGNNKKEPKVPKVIGDDDPASKAFLEHHSPQTEAVSRAKLPLDLQSKNTTTADSTSPRPNSLASKLLEMASRTLQMGNREMQHPNNSSIRLEPPVGDLEIDTAPLVLELANATVSRAKASETKAVKEEVNYSQQEQSEEPKKQDIASEPAPTKEPQKTEDEILREKKERQKRRQRQEEKRKGSKTSSEDASSINPVSHAKLEVADFHDAEATKETNNTDKAQQSVEEKPTESTKEKPALQSDTDLMSLLSDDD